MSGKKIGHKKIYILMGIAVSVLIFSACGEQASPPPLVARESMEIFVDSSPDAVARQRNNLLLRRGLTLTASSHNLETESVRSLIDGEDGSIWHVEISALGAPAWVMVDFGEGNNFKVRRLAAQPRKDIPRQFFRFAELFGSHDGVNWENVAPIVQEEAPRTNDWRDWAFDNSTAYRFYRLDIMNGHGGVSGDQFLSIAGLGLFE